MRARITLALTIALVAVTVSRAGRLSPAEDPVSVFAALDGTWAGTFVGYDASGVELYRIEVRQTYRTVSETVQEVTIRDTLPDGTVITGTGRNTAGRNLVAGFVRGPRREW